VPKSKLGLLNLLHLPILQHQWLPNNKWSKFQEISLRKGQMV